MQYLCYDAISPNRLVDCFEFRTGSKFRRTFSNSMGKSWKYAQEFSWRFIRNGRVERKKNFSFIITFLFCWLHWNNNRIVNANHFHCYNRTVKYWAETSFLKKNGYIVILTPIVVLYDHLQKVATVKIMTIKITLKSEQNTVDRHFQSTIYKLWPQ